MRNKLMWFYQEVDDTDSVAQQEAKPGPSRAATSNPSKTPQGKYKIYGFMLDFINAECRKVHITSYYQ